MKPVKFLVMVIILFDHGVVDAQTKAQKIDKLLSQYYSYGQFNGTALIAEHDKLILKKGWGYANFEWNIPNTTDTKFRIGSITKTFTDLLAFQQIEKGKLKLDAHISDYLPGYPKPQGEQITIHQLMTHVSGLPDYDEMDIDYADYYPHEKILAMFDSLPLEFTPGTKFKYTNSGAFLLGVILEKITGKTYEQLLNENILQPLALRNTGYDHSDHVLEKRATGYKVFVPQRLQDQYIDVSVPYAAYGMYSTCEDLYQWSKMLGTNTLISKNSMGEYLNPVLNDWACDWLIMKNPYGEATDSTVMILRGGSNGSFIGFVGRIIKDKNSIVLLDNTRSSNLEEIIGKIVAILYDRPYQPPRQSLQIAFTRLVREEGMATAVNKIKKLRLDTAKYYLRGSEFFNMGYTFRFAMNDLQSAIAVLELLRDFYPGNFNPNGENSAMKTEVNVYGALGDTYLQAGQKEKAIECLKKALELNPKDNRAAEMLEKLSGSH
jgi:CubicO group peptidase (beta-lactamase class C family)